MPRPTNQPSNYSLHWCGLAQIAPLFGIGEVELRQVMNRAELIDVRGKPTALAKAHGLHDAFNGRWRKYGVADWLEDRGLLRCTQSRYKINLGWTFPCAVQISDRTHKRYGQRLTALRLAIDHDSEGNQNGAIVLSNGSRIHPSRVQRVEGT
ncbi:MAG TPA: hypothetical protein V6C95_06250 [Coleofasciculaceae cyanobacterium]